MDQVCGFLAVPGRPNFPGAYRLLVNHGLAKRLIGDDWAQAELTLSGHHVLVRNTTSAFGADFISLVTPSINLALCVAPAVLTSEQAEIYRALRTDSPLLRINDATTASLCAHPSTWPLRRAAAA